MTVIDGNGRELHRWLRVIGRDGSLRYISCDDDVRMGQSGPDGMDGRAAASLLLVKRHLVLAVKMREVGAGSDGR